MVCAPVRSFSDCIIHHTGTQTMLCLTCFMISNVDHALYRVSRTKGEGTWGLWYTFWYSPLVTSQRKEITANISSDLCWVIRLLDYRSSYLGPRVFNFQTF